MTEFKDFLDQIKIRLTNPLIFSFLISWVIIHWQIFVGAFYLTTNDLSELGHINFLDFVKTSINWYNGFWYPLFSAIIYTGISPLIRIWIQLFNTWINKMGNERIRKVAQEGFIQYEMYDKILEEVQLQRKRNESLITENIEFSNDIENKKQELIDKNSKVTLLQNEVNKSQNQYNSMFDSTGLDGIWKVIIKDSNGSTSSSAIFKIKNTQVEERQTDGHFHPKYNISNFIKLKNDEMSFIMYQTKPNINNDVRHFNYYNQLKHQGTGKMEGRYNDSYNIVFERQSDFDLSEPLLTNML